MEIRKYEIFHLEEIINLIFPMSETRLVPDLYHIVQHTLILLNIVVCLAR